MRLVDLFAGGGGLALGLSRAGFNDAVLVELDHYASATIRDNIQRRVPNTENWQLLQGSVTDVDYSALTGHIDLLSAGLPCQPFSVAGKGRAHQDRRDMFCEVVRAAREIKPKAILIENVKGLLRPRFRDYFDYLLLAISAPGPACVVRDHWKGRLDNLRCELAGDAPDDERYSVYVHEINAADFGVPQWRERVLIVAFRNDLRVNWAPFYPTHSLDSLLWTQWKTGEYWRRHGLVVCDSDCMTQRVARRLTDLRKAEEWEKPGRLPWVTVRDAISDLPPPPATEREDVPNHFLNPGARLYARHTGSALDEPAKTLKAGNHGVPGGENTLLLEPGAVRYFSIRECARLQTFPDTYVFRGPWSRAMRQVGNAVPVELARIVGDRIRSHLTGAEISRQARGLAGNQHPDVPNNFGGQRTPDDRPTANCGAARRNESRDSRLRSGSRATGGRSNYGQPAGQETADEATLD